LTIHLQVKVKVTNLSIPEMKSPISLLEVTEVAEDIMAAEDIMEVTEVEVIMVTMEAEDAMADIMATMETIGIPEMTDGETTEGGGMGMAGITMDMDMDIMEFT